MNDGYLLAIDQGTHATRAIVFDRQGGVVTSAHRPVALHTRGTFEAEQDADEILDSLRQVVAEVLAAVDVPSSAFHAAGLATQRSSVVAWNRVSGAVLSPVLSWQDRRNQALIDVLAPHAHTVTRKTGLRLSPHYGASKLRWLLEHEPAVQQAHDRRQLLMGPLVSWLLFHWLEGRPALVDHANAARTLLWNLHTRDWDPELLNLFAIPADLLPACRSVCAEYGCSQPGAIPLRAVNGDQTAALYAQGQPARGTVTVNLGTGAFVLLPVERLDNVPGGLLAGIANSTAEQAEYYLEGTVNGAGAALDQVARQWGIQKPEQLLPEWLRSVEDPPLFMNTVGGLGAPWWQAGPEAHFSGQPATAAHALVAVAESILFLVQANVELLEQQAGVLDCIRISGGLARLDGLCQKLADLSGLRVLRPEQIEATARGVAWLAAARPTGWMSDTTMATFHPHSNPDLQLRYRRFIERLRQLV